MYSIVESSMRYLTERFLLMKRRAKVEETSLAIQLVTVVMLRRYLLSKSESNINFSGFDPLRLITTMPCCPRIASSCRKRMRYILRVEIKCLVILHLLPTTSQALQKTPINQHHKVI